jgi:uncharacterized protein (UPF0332 family)
MSLQHDLLHQAHHLALKEPKKPKQASLRRAVSSAYYAVFHMLIDDATRSLLALKHQPLRERLRRAFEHGEMKLAANAYRNSKQPDLSTVALTFIELQEARHVADYDTSKSLTRVEVLAQIQDAQNAFAAWQRVKATVEAQEFMVALLVQKRWKR